MNLEKLVAISGNVNGVFTMIANRNNGLIVEDLKTQKRIFASSRQNQFTPLESVGIFTDDGDTADIKAVFKNMLEQLEDNPPIPVKSSAADLKEYFKDVLPNFDEERVYPGDIRKVIKWFKILNENNLFEVAAAEDEKDAETTDEQPEENTEK